MMIKSCVKRTLTICIFPVPGYGDQYHVLERGLLAAATQTAIANGYDEIQRKAACDANAVQDGVNIVAIVGSFHRHLLALHGSGIRGDDLINHPIAFSFTSKLNSLCRMTACRELNALRAVRQIKEVESVEYEVIPL